MTRPVSVSRSIAALLLGVGAALSGTSDLGAVALDDYLGKSKGEIAASLEAQGYVVEEFETEDGMIEVEANIDGTSYEIHVDPTTGRVVHLEEDD